MFTEVAEYANSIKFEMALADYFLEHTIYEAEGAAMDVYQECKESAIPFAFEDKRKILIEATNQTLKDKFLAFFKSIKVKIEKVVFMIIKTLRRFCNDSANKFRKLMGKDESVVIHTRSIDIPMVFKYIDGLISKLTATMEISKPIFEGFKEISETKTSTPYMLTGSANEVYTRYFSGSIGFQTLDEVRNSKAIAEQPFNTARLATTLTVKEIRDYSAKITSTIQNCEVMRTEYEKYRMSANNLAEDIANRIEVSDVIKSVTVFTSTVSEIIISLTKAIAFTCAELEKRIQQLVTEAEKALK